MLVEPGCEFVPVDCVCSALPPGRGMLLNRRAREALGALLSPCGEFSTLDLDPADAPDFLQDARAPHPTGFRAILADPPYSRTDAEQYAPGRDAYREPEVILRRALDALRPGRRVSVLHVRAPRPPTKGVRFAPLLPCLSATAIRCASSACSRSYEPPARAIGFALITAAEAGDSQEGDRTRGPREWWPPIRQAAAPLNTHIK